MYFSNHRTIVKPQSQSSGPIMMFPQSYQTILRARSVPPTVPTSPPADATIVQERPKSMKWGQPTWFLLHTLAQKVKAEAFPHIRKDLLDVIFKICNNLPCPDCASHATQHLNGINFNTIQSKEDLQVMLYNFHNIVNKKKGFELFDYQDLETKYSTANTVRIYQYFMQFFEQRNYSLRVGTTTFNRNMVIAYLKQWFANNIQYFDP